MGWFVWRSRYREGFCALGALENVPRDEELRRGQSRAADFPKDAFYQMRDDYKDTAVADNAYAMIHHVVSSRLRALVEPAPGARRVQRPRPDAAHDERRARAQADPRQRHDLPAAQLAEDFTG